MELECAAIPEEGLRILHVSDIHLSPEYSHRIEALERAADTTWDFLLLTGDYADQEDALPLLTEAVAGIRARYGKFAVLGNHDYFRYSAHNPWRWVRVLLGSLRHHRPDTLGQRLDTGLLVRALEKAGVRVLFNEVDTGELPGGGCFQIFGIDDPCTGHDCPRRLYGQADIRALRLVLTHSPRRLEPLTPLSPHLVLCGHTHGGQICLPFIGAISTGSDAHRRAVAGWVDLAGLRLHISRGMGAGSVFPWRILAPAEITSLRLIPSVDVPEKARHDTSIVNVKP